EPTPLDCSPPLPMFYVLIMAYPCDKRCVGFVSAQLYEVAKPERIDIDLNGVWQTITWERQALVASSCDDFANEVGMTIDEIAAAFADRFQFYHRVEERLCFPRPKTAQEEEEYNRIYNPNYKSCECHPIGSW